MRDGIEKGQAFPVLLHELGEHANQLGFSKDADYQSILKSLENRKDAKGATGDAIRAAMAKVPASTKPEHYWSEVAAYLIEQNANTELSIVDRIKAFFKKWLVKVGIFSSSNLSHKDLVIFARAAVNAASGGNAVQSAMLSVRETVNFNPVVEIEGGDATTGDQGSAQLSYSKNSELDANIDKTGEQDVQSQHEKEKIKEQGFRVNEGNRYLTDILEGVLPEGVRVTPYRVPDSRLASDRKGRVDLGRIPRSDFDVAERLSRIFGKKIIWSTIGDSFDTHGVIVTGSKFLSDKIFIDIRTPKPVHAVLGHELLHHLKEDHPEIYDDLYRSVEGLITGTEQYRGILPYLKNAHSPIINEEIIGDLLGDSFTSPSFWKDVAAQAGGNPFRQSFDLPGVGDGNRLQAVLNSVTPIGRKAKELKAQGYDVTISKDTKPIDDVFDATSLITSLDAILQESMGSVDKNDSGEVRAAQIVDQILTMQIADIFKARGYLASRMKRLSGDEVWEGYETDMGKALTQ